MNESEIAHRLGILEAKIDMILDQTKTLHGQIDAQGRDINIVRGMGLFAVFLSGLGITWSRLFGS